MSQSAMIALIGVLKSSAHSYVVTLLIHFHCVELASETTSLINMIAGLFSPDIVISISLACVSREEKVIIIYQLSAHDTPR